MTTTKQILMHPMLAASNIDFDIDPVTGSDMPVNDGTINITNDDAILYDIFINNLAKLDNKSLLQQNTCVILSFKSPNEKNMKGVLC